ncbi:MerR family transcriptional regulator [uncultured Clostridium sp.]|uniref:MerR family transcriptional regulator n=1 Tax=uncultured Clostridium sp. TaxID=59620 RepID=UPI002600842A|nr:MerR family transcriptional regulator [uncultured Clostridium sp.]
MTNHYTISEVATLFNISKQTVRYYDKIGLVKPAVHQEGSNYRLYSQNELNQFALIRELKASGLSLSEIKAYCDEKDITKLECLLKKNKKNLEEQIFILNRQKNNTDFYIKALSQAKRVYQKNKYEIKTVKKRCVYFLNISFVTDDLREYIELLHRSYSAAYSGKLPREHGHVVLFIEPEHLNKREFKTYTGIGLLFDKIYQDKKSKIIEEGLYATTIHIGDYKKIHQTYKKLCQYIYNEGYVITGSSTEISVTNITFTTNPNEFITEIQIPVRKNIQNENQGR